jgi:hypothetical protein
VQQQPAGADLLQAELRFQLQPGLLFSAAAAGAERQGVAPQQGLQRQGAPLAKRQQQVGVAVPPLALRRTQPKASNPHWRVGGAQLQQQACLAGELGAAGHHHMGAAVGLSEAVLRHLAAKGLGRAHRQPAVLLQLLQLRLGPAGEAPAQGRHRRDNR